MKLNGHLDALIKLLLLTSSLLVSCVREIDHGVEASDSGLLKFGILHSNYGVPQTKGVSSGDSQKMEHNGPSDLDDIYIYVIEDDYPIEETEIFTKAEGDTISPRYGVFAYFGAYTGTIPASFDPSEATEFAPMQNLPLYADGGYSGNPIYAPLGKNWMQFYAYGPYQATTNTPALSISTENCSPTILYTAASDAASQYDLIGGGTNVPVDVSVTSPVDLSMSHLLSLVRVKVGTIESGTVKSITISGIKGSGTYSLLNKEWTDVNTPSSYVQPAGDETLTQDPITGYLGYPFYFLPQELTDEAQITIHLEVNATSSLDGSSRTMEYDVTKKLNTIIDEWMPNKQYTYVISTPQEVDIEVTDEVVFEDGYPVKKNLSITNIGLSDAYVRVHITGAWYVNHVDKNGQQQKILVSDWDNDGEDVDDGEFVWPNGIPNLNSPNANNWMLGSDGYYYYIKKAASGDTIEQLFDKYILKAQAPMAKAYLDLTVVVQAVYPLDAPTVWPSEIQQFLK